MKRFVVFITACLLVSFYSCKKDDDPTNTELLCSQPWMLSASTFDPPFHITDFGAITDYYAILAPCRKDDIWSFKTNGDYTIEDGASKCNPLDPTVLEFGSWVFNTDETVITTSTTYYYTEYTILELSSQTLQVRSTLIDTLDNVYYWTETYNH